MTREELNRMTELNHNEVLRVNALSLACEYCLEMVSNGTALPMLVTHLHVIEVAMAFELFLSGRRTRKAVVETPEPTEEQNVG